MLNCKLIDKKNCISQGIEKKTAKLKGSERAVVARHEAGHAVVGTAVANLLPGQPRVEVYYGNILTECNSVYFFICLFIRSCYVSIKFEMIKEKYDI